MFVAYTVIAVLLALGLLVSAAAKLRRVPQLVDGFTSLGVPPGMLPFLAACEIAGAGGLVIGLWYPPLGIAAAIGLVLYFVGAVGAHLRSRDFKGMPNATVMLAASAAALILEAISN
jgi:DoxX-like family